LRAGRRRTISSIAYLALLGLAMLLGLAGVVVAGFAVYQLTLAVAAFFYRGFRRGAEADPPRSRLVVVVPAHDEAELIGRCVQSLHAQTYPRDLYEVVVVADNCTDETAALARAAGAQVLVRDVPNARGKGHALRWAIERVVDRKPAPDAIVVVDADSAADPSFLEALVAPFARGAHAVQGESLLSPEGSPQAALRATAFLLVNRVRPAGRAVLGGACNLAGNGMLFSREVLLTHPWSAFTSAEDLEYSIRLQAEGVRPAFAGGAVLRSPAAPNPRAAAEQQLRWEGGKAHLARTQIPRLLARAVRERRPSLVGTAFELAVPPLGLLAAAVAVGTIVASVLLAAGAVPVWPLAPWVVAVAAIPLYVLVGLVAAGAPGWAYRSLLRAPLIVLGKLLHVRRVVGFDAMTWVRTERAGEEPPPLILPHRRRAPERGVPRGSHD